MLVEVQCNKFIKHGQIREPIRFHAGLNAVLGDDNGSNSIGKSTFLMILDFVFGGMDYVRKCVDVQESVKEHTINFTFEFEGKQYHFSRNSIDYNRVIICDSNYDPIPDAKPLNLQEYGEFLCEKYGLSAEGLTWRGAVGRFIRVYKRDTLDEERPLRSSKDEKASDVVKNYMRLFNRYSAVEKQIIQAAEAEEKDPLDTVCPAATRADVVRMQAEVRAVTAKDSILSYLTRLALASRENPMTEIGISPRGVLFLDRMAKARAYLQGRDYVIAEDVQAVFADVCAHRVILTQKARLSGVTAEQVLSELLRTVKVPDGFSS